MKKSCLGFIAGMLLLAGCSNEEKMFDLGNEGLKTFSSFAATLSDDADTRVYMNQDAFNGKRSAYWEDNDEIALFSDLDELWQNYKLTNMSNMGQSAEFAGEAITGYEFFAVYPTIEGIAQLTGSDAKKVILVWPYDVIYDSTNLNHHLPMFARSSNNQLQFKQLGGILHFQIYGKGILKSVVLAANNADMTGIVEKQFVIGQQFNHLKDNLVMESVPDFGNTDDFDVIEATIQPYSDGKAHELSISKPFDIYFSLPAGMTFENGISVTVNTEVTNSDSSTTPVSFVKKSANPITIERAIVANFPAFSTIEVSPTPEPENGWITNFNNLSGKDFTASYFYSMDNTQIWWDLVFKTDSNPEDGTSEPIIIEFPVDNNVEQPTISMLDGIKTTGFVGSSKLYDYKTGYTYRVVESSSGLEIKKNTDGTWSLSINDMTLKENKGGTGNLTGIYLKFNGLLSNDQTVYEDAWGTTGGLSFMGTEKKVSALVDSEKIYWSFSFIEANEDKTNKMVLISFETPYTGEAPTLSMLDKFETAVFGSNFHDYTNGEVTYWRAEGDESKLTINQTSEGVWKMSIEKISVESNAGPLSEKVNFYYEGSLALEIEKPKQDLINKDGVINASLLPFGFWYDSPDNDKWSFSFSDYDENGKAPNIYSNVEITIIHSGSTIPTGTFTQFDMSIVEEANKSAQTNKGDFYGDSPDSSNAKLVITKNGDNYTFKVTELKVTNTDYENDVFTATFEWTGKMTEFIPEAKEEPYMVLNGNELTFYYDNKKKEKDGAMDGWEIGEGLRLSIKEVIFNYYSKDNRPTTTSRMFENCSNLTTITGIRYLDTSSVTDMSFMFSGCSALTTLDLSSFNTSIVTNMGSMFYNCSSLENLNINNFDTWNVEDMGSMFYSCSSLKNLDVRNFHTSSVTNMKLMFYQCSSLQDLDVSGFDTSKVTDMSGMFSGCSSLTSLYLNEFDTTNVIDMNNMFNECKSLQSLDLNSFNTSSVKSVEGMFANCSNLISLDVSNFNISNVESMKNLFYMCSMLQTIYGNDWTTNGISEGMFYQCVNLKGGQGSKLGDDNVWDDIRSAHIDGGPSNPGLFTQN